MSNTDIDEDTETENKKEFENGNGFDTQQQVPHRRELSREELDLMDILEHKNTPMFIMDFKKDKPPIEAEHIYDKEKGPAPVTYFPVTLPEDPDYTRYYKVTSKKLRRAILTRYLPKDKTRLEITRAGTGKSTTHKLREIHEDRLLVLTNDKDYFEEVPLQQKRL
jgi:hypothetical protein